MTLITGHPGSMIDQINEPHSVIFDGSENREEAGTLQPFLYRQAHPSSACLECVWFYRKVQKKHKPAACRLSSRVFFLQCVVYHSNTNFIVLQFLPSLSEHATPYSSRNQENGTEACHHLIHQEYPYKKILRITGVSAQTVGCSIIRI
jgi:hypothetical protein